MNHYDPTEQITITYHGEDYTFCKGDLGWIIEALIKSRDSYQEHVKQTYARSIARDAARYGLTLDDITKAFQP